jgi:hypothetical protein
MDIRIALLVGIAVTLAACAGTAPRSRDEQVAAQEETDCLWTGTITDWKALDDRNLLVRASGDRGYHIELAQSCFDLEFADVIAFHDRGRDERICGFGMDRVIVDRAIPETCGIVAVDEVTEDQAEELLARYGESERPLP